MIDFHCHIDLYPNPESVMQECVSRGIYTLSVTNTPSSWSGTSKLEGNAARIRTALGLHPQIAHERYGEIDLFESIISQTRYVGEVGLDGGGKKAHQVDQLAVFKRILEICKIADGRVLSLHSRRATQPVLDELEKQPDAGIPILHWFSGSKHELERAIELGCWFSVGPTMLSSARGRQLFASMPKDRIVTETDGPFTLVGQRSIYPWEVELAYPAISEAWNVPLEEVQQLLLKNLRKLSDVSPIVT